jgi:hypothetical protein
LACRQRYQLHQKCARNETLACQKMTCQPAAVIGVIIKSGPVALLLWGESQHAIRLAAPDFPRWTGHLAAHKALSRGACLRERGPLHDGAVTAEPSSLLRNSRFQIGHHRSPCKAVDGPRSCSYTGDLPTQQGGLCRPSGIEVFSWQAASRRGPCPFHPNRRWPTTRPCPCARSRSAH